MYMNLHFGIPQIIATLWLIICCVSAWANCIGRKYNTITFIIAFMIEFGVLYWGGFYTN